MSKYKVGDKFIVEIGDVFSNDADDFIIEEETLYKVEGFKSLVFDSYGLDKLQKYDEVKEKLELIDELKQVEYNRGLQDAWELAHKCVAFTDECKLEVFDTNNPYCIIAKQTYQEALAKIEAYEKSQQIQVGDVVYSSATDNKEGICVGCGNDGEEYALVWFKEYDCPQNMSVKHLKKTGRHIDIEHILEQIRGNE